ncbi:DUF4148 domain-containing protein [Caballeronia glebae]|uniref:DUF4148 domain-containing protein n=1 Tax=Caballeronia glebae TaxID=1777143 RepID=UPI0038B7C049
MKLLSLLFTGAVLAFPLVGFAQQSTAPLTRAEVRADLRQVEKAGYNPARRDEATYPADIQAAEARAAAHYSTAHTDTTGLGGAKSFSSDSGRSSANNGAVQSLYRHH